MSRRIFTAILAKRKERLKWMMGAKMANDNLLSSAARGDLAGLTAALSAGANVDALDKYGSTALMAAAKAGHGECVEALLGAGRAWKFWIGNTDRP